METFEKKYNEALGWMQKIYPTLTGANKEDAEHYFPELKEQPDPRHSIIEFIKWSCDRGSITPEQKKNVDFWLAYLERQKEQKPIPTEDEKDFLEKEVKAFLCNYDKEFDDDAPTYDIAEHFYQLGKNSQKPAEWSEEDEEMIDYIIHVLSNNTYVKEEGPTIYAKEIDWLKSIRPVNQKWSDDDEIWAHLILRELEKVKEDSPEYSKHFARLIDWFTHRFKSLRPQIKQELNEENKNKIESIKGLITTGKFVDTNTIKTIWKLLDALRLQPHWKPSKEQMTYLKEAISKFDFCDAENAGLHALYNDLQNYFSL